MSWVCWVLEQSWWQGIAGMAQIVAGLLAAYTVIQARKTIRQADEERKHSVRPDWDASCSVANKGGVKQDSQVTMSTCFGKLPIYLWNSGLGPARDATVTFEPNNDNEPYEFSHTLQGLGPHLVRPDGRIGIQIWWHIDRPLDGLLIVTCQTRFGERPHNTFHLQAWTDRQGVPCRKLTRVR